MLSDWSMKGRMEHPHSLEMVAFSDPGRVRPHNEDAVHVNPECGLAILADGLGGYRAGEVASCMAVASLAQLLEAPLQQGLHSEELLACFEHAVQGVNHQICEAAACKPAYAGMATTIVMGGFVLHQRQLVLAHVGDSRCYRLREGGLDLLTHDHSVIQEQLDQGLIKLADIPYSPDRGLLTRALGVEAPVQQSLCILPTLAGDVYLFCSDGLSDMLNREQMAEILLCHVHDLAQAGQTLVAAANQNGGRDNISVILVRVVD